MMVRSFLLAAFITVYINAAGAKVDTVVTHSDVMKKNIKAVVILPDGYSSALEYPVVYLLHGHGGNYADWIIKAKGLEKAADAHHIIIVCPDGNRGSWYWDSPVDSSSKYETYITAELVKFIDSKYKTIRNRRGRAITGLSMGGQGALYLAFRHQDVYGAAGSMSGGVDIRPFPANWDMAKQLGSYAAFPERWEEHAVINMTYLLMPDSLELVIDCGTEDFFYKVNAALHEKLLYSNIKHDFITRPGAHNWPYWTNAIQYQLLFMNNFFQKTKQ